MKYNVMYKDKNVKMFKNIILLNFTYMKRKMVSFVRPSAFDNFYSLNICKIYIHVRKYLVTRFNLVRDLFKKISWQLPQHLTFLFSRFSSINREIVVNLWKYIIWLKSDCFSPINCIFEYHDIQYWTFIHLIIKPLFRF